MHPSNLLAFAASLGLAVAQSHFVVDGLKWGGNDVVHIGNTRCGQNTWEFKNNYCDGNAKVHLGDDVPKGCKPPGGTTYHNNHAAGHCKLHQGNVYQ